MKKIILCSAWIFISCIFVSCQKEGPVGPAGSDGAQGEKGEKGDKGDPGVKGDPGSMSITVYDATISAWTASKYVTASFTGKVSKLDKIVTTNIINAGAILVYEVQKNVLKALPYFQAMEKGNPFAEDGTSDYTLTATYDVAPGELSVYLQYSGIRMQKVASKTFRLIVIPGTPGKRVSSRSAHIAAKLV